MQSILFALQTTNEPGITAGIVAIGGMAVGAIAVGGGALGYYALGAGGIGRYVPAFGGLGQYLFTLKRRDPEAVGLFRLWLPWLGKYVK